MGSDRLDKQQRKAGRWWEATRRSAREVAKNDEAQCWKGGHVSNQSPHLDESGETREDDGRAQGVVLLERLRPAGGRGIERQRRRDIGYAHSISRLPLSVARLGRACHRGGEADARGVKLRLAVDGYRPWRPERPHRSLEVGACASAGRDRRVLRRRRGARDTVALGGEISSEWGGGGRMRAGALTSGPSDASAHLASSISTKAVCGTNREAASFSSSQQCRRFPASFSSSQQCRRFPALEAIAK